MINIREKLAQPPVYENLGRITDPAGFSQRCREIFNAGSIDTHINWTPETGYDLHEVPGQFHPVILKAIEEHNKDHAEMTQCYVHFNQGLLKPKQTFRAKHTHIDAVAGLYPNTSYPNNDVFSVSDSLPTQFSLQTYNMPDHLYLEDFELDYKLSDIITEQLSEDHIVTPGTYDLVRFDSFTAHRAQLPTKKTERTFLMVRFF